MAGEIDRELETQAAAHRVADVGGASAELPEGAGRYGERQSVGHVDELIDDVASEVRPDRHPRLGGLAESGDEHAAHPGILA